MRLFQQAFFILLSLVFSNIFAAYHVPSAGQQAVRNVEQRSDQGKTSGQWLEDLKDVLSTMQSSFWSRNGWPTTIDWTGAVMDTLLIASDMSFANALNGRDHNGLQYHPQTSQAVSRILEYASQIKAFYGSEHVARIHVEAYDDVQWVVLEWLEAIRFIQLYNTYAPPDVTIIDLSFFAHRAHVFYDIVHDQFNTSTCGGGITWNPKLATYKNAITNELFISSSIAMYLYFPGDDNTNPYSSSHHKRSADAQLPDLPPLQAHDLTLLDNAVKAYDWFKTQNFKNAQGLIIDGFHISQDQTTCDQRNEMVYTYNQGVVLSGLRGLWEATGDKTYLYDGYALVDTVISATGWNATDSSQWAGLGLNGVMEDYCDARGTCSQDNQMFKGIYFHHLDRFCEPLSISTPLIPGLTQVASDGLAAKHRETCNSYIPWLEHNANAALATRDTKGVIRGWWGANVPDRSQAATVFLTVANPPHSIDVHNDASALDDPLWHCNGQHGCQQNGSRSDDTRQRRSTMPKIFNAGLRRRDQNDAGRGRTVETQGSGLSVVNAAFDFIWRAAI